MEYVAQRTGLHHPDFVVTIAENPVTDYCLSWTVADREEGKSSIEVELDNLDMRFSPQINMGDKIAIRFGLMGGQLGPKIAMKLLKYQEVFDRGGVKLKAIGLDDSHQMDNQTGRGHQKGKDIKANADAVAKNANITIEHGDEQPPQLGQEEPCARTPIKAGTTVSEHVETLKNQSTTGEGESISGEDDKKTEGADTGKQSEPKTEQQATASGVRPGKVGERDKNRLDNARKRADSKTITGRLSLVGQPFVFAKKCITLLNVGPKASGKWYVSEAVNKWSRSGGYVTECQLLRDVVGENKEGPGKESQPMVMYAEITKPGTVYSGPRKIDAESQATFTWGDGNYIIRFDWQIDLHTKKGQKKKSTGKTVDPKKPQKPIEEKKSPETSTESSGDDAPQLSA